MRYGEAPDEHEGPGPSVFLAGGISGCDDWQARAAAMLAGSALVVLNPRWKNFPMDDPTVAEAQIAWEFRHLRRAAARCSSASTPTTPAGRTWKSRPASPGRT